MKKFSDNTAKLALQILKKVISVNSTMGSGQSGYKPPAKWIFDALKCSDEKDFILALAYLREYYSMYYDKLNIPSSWNGCAHLEHPELFLDGDVINLIAKRNIEIIFIDDNAIGPFKIGEEFFAPRKNAIPLIKRRFAEVIIPK